jgi:hypothetical protein
LLVASTVAAHAQAGARFEHRCPICRRHRPYFSTPDRENSLYTGNPGFVILHLARCPAHSSTPSLDVKANPIGSCLPGFSRTGQNNLPPAYF